jgi:ribosomal protein L24
MKAQNEKINKLHVKTGDNVKVIAGNDRGKTGRIVSVKKDLNKVVVEGVNLVTKHNKPSAKKSARWYFQARSAYPCQQCAVSRCFRCSNPHRKES